LLPSLKIYKLRATLSLIITKETGDPPVFGAAAWRWGLYDNPFDAVTHGPSAHP
jgi:hypothetical protein